MTGRFWPAGSLMSSPLLRGILGVRVTASRAVPIGKPIRDHRGDVIAHPLDIVAFRGHDPHRRLDAALEWIRDDTTSRFDQAIAALTVDGHDDRQIIADHEAEAVALRYREVRAYVRERYGFSPEPGEADHLIKPDGAAAMFANPLAPWRRCKGDR